MKNKIIQINKLNIILNKLRKNKSIVQCHGVFDLLHIGHIKHFEQAKQLGDILIVSVTADKYVNKGPGKPRFNQKLRAEAIASIGVVDFVLISNDLTPLKMIGQIKPNFYCKGKDYKNKKEDITGNIKKEIKLVNRFGGKTIFTDEITFSSSNLINTYFSTNNKFQERNIDIIKKKFSYKQITQLIEKFTSLKVLIIGELIIDQYVFCEAVGKSGKEPVLTLREINSEKYLGGAAVVARHLSTFCKKIKLITMLGDKKKNLNFIKSSMPKNIKFDFIEKKNSPTILKKRFVEHLTKNKILGVYDINDDPLDKLDEAKLGKLINKEVSKYDLVIVSDYGHGFLSKKNIKNIVKKSKYTAVNSQINSFNIGLHGVRNYKKLDCLIINEKEMRYELRSRDGDLKQLIKKLATEQNIKKLIVTRGSNGAIMYDSINSSFFYAAAFSDKSVDKVGSGDAMLSLISICQKLKLDQNLSLFISSIAGALSVSNIGNKESITKVQILKSVNSLLK